MTAPAEISLAPLAKADWCLAALTFEFDLCNRWPFGPSMMASPSPNVVTCVDLPVVFGAGASAIATDERPITAPAPNIRHIRLDTDMDFSSNACCALRAPDNVSGVPAKRKRG